ncbi:unnamed protein product [Rhodiola kirilowii]
MGGCFSGQKALDSENAPVQAPASPKAVKAVTEPTAESVETQKEEPLVDVAETKEEVKKDDEVLTVAAEADEKAPETVAVGDVKEESKVGPESSGPEDKTSAAPATL